MKTPKIPSDPKITSATPALEAWRAAQAGLLAALTRARRATATAAAAPSFEARLAKVRAEREVLEAEDAERRARAVATWKCDARDVAAGEPAALACSLEALAAELAAGGARAAARLAAAREGEATLAAKRDLAGEPSPRRIPRAGNLAAELAAILAAGPVAPQSNADRIRTLRAEETAIRRRLKRPPSSSSPRRADAPAPGQGAA